MQKWFEYSEKFDALSQREKMMAFAAGLVVIVMVAFTYGIEPLLIENSSLKTEAVSLQRQISSLEQQQQAYAIALAEDPNRELNAQLKQLDKRLQRVDETFANEVEKLVPPSVMPALMANVLGLSKSLELQDVQALPPQSIFTAETELAEQADASLYQHSIRMVFKGTFADSKQFLSALEQTQWQVYWHVMTYEVEEYPTAELTIEFYTLSTEKVFIRV